MTEFEEQVARAMDYVADQQGVVWRGTAQAEAVQRAIRVLAPQVAAAIEDVVLSASAIRDTDQRPPWRWGEIALAALRRARGGPPA